MVFMFILRQFRLYFNLLFILCMASFNISQARKCLGCHCVPKIEDLGFCYSRAWGYACLGMGVQGVSVSATVYWLADIIARCFIGQLILRPQWPQLSSVITKVKNPLKTCSQCGRAQPECPVARSCFLLE